jgi:hypothetical protein
MSLAGTTRPDGRVTIRLAAREIAWQGKTISADAP